MSARYRTKSLARLVCLLTFMGCLCSLNADEPTVDPETGLIMADNWNLVKTHCMLCHSTKGFTQVRMDRKNWEKIIRQMQEKNGLWQLGTLEPKILDYLEGNYGLPEQPHNSKIRRPLD